MPFPFNKLLFAVLVCKGIRSLGCCGSLERVLTAGFQQKSQIVRSSCSHAPVSSEPETSIPRRPVQVVPPGSCSVGSESRFMSSVAQTIAHSCSGKEFGSLVFCKTSRSRSCTGSSYAEMRGKVTPASTAEEQHLEVFPQTFCPHRKQYFWGYHITVHASCFL